jgi:predicted histone-like DNA-binding protein
MAKILYEVKQNKADKSKAFGKWFGYVKSLETLNTRRLAKHISEHGSVYTQDVVFGVLEKFRACLIEMLLDSKKVKIDGLGTFYCTIENQKGGADQKDKFNVNTHLKALHIRFMPEQEQEMNISSREFLKQAEFINVESLLKGDDTGASGGTSNSGSSQSANSGNSGSGNSGSGNSGNTGGGGNDDDDVTYD